MPNHQIPLNGTRTDQKREYNKQVYISYLFRVRSESGLARRLTEHMATGETSINFLITEALCVFLNVELPHKYYDIKKRTKIWPPIQNERVNTSMQTMPVQNCHQCAYEFEPGDNYYDLPGFPILCEDCITEFAKTVPVT